jgi:hypothetical protein
MPDQLSQSPCIHGTNLLNENPGGLAFDFRLGSKRRCSSASRCRGNNDDPSRQEFVGLNHYGEAVAVLFVTYAFR